MAINSKFFDSIRISSGKKAKAEPETITCQWEGCDKPGLHRAPAGRNREGQFLHFCIEHVREYNKNFNYFSDLSDEEIAKFQKDAVTGHRPTWTSASNRTTATKTSQEFSAIRSGSAVSQKRMRNPYGLINEKRAEAAPKRKLKVLEAKAFITLELKEFASSDEIKSQYKVLIKRHHPDANGGDRGSEERFRAVLQAYNLLKKAGFC